MKHQNKSALLLTLLALTAELSFAEEFAPIVQLKGGKVRGTVVQSDDGSKVLAYQGIRYGHAARFAKPVPAEPWTDVYNATHWRDACVQTGFDVPPYHDPAAQTKTMSEDCLYVSVWRPQTEAKAKARAVMVYYHGGSFVRGTIFSTMYDGRYLASRDVVLVTVNSRLGVLGYLYGNTTDAPGNQAVWDQYLALKWVHENIHAFGGDPKKVTIFGESAGVFPISAFSVSPLTKSLFQRAILQSGAPTSANTNAVTQPLKRTELVAQLLACPLGQMASTLSCLKSKSIDQILTAQKTLEALSAVPGAMLGDQLLPFESFISVLNAGKFHKDIDFMYGVTRDEGTYFVGLALNEFDLNSTVLTVTKVKEYILKVSLGKSYGHEVADFYTKHLKSSATQTELKQVISHAFADPWLMCPTILFGEAIVKGSPGRKHYSYKLTQHSKTPFPLAGGCDGWRGVCHGEDVVYLFGVHYTKSNAADYQMSKDMISAWTSFAKTGSPGKLGTTEWTEALTASDPFTRHMNLDTTDFKMVKDAYKEICNAFWKPKIFV